MFRAPKRPRNQLQLVWNQEHINWPVSSGNPNQAILGTHKQNIGNTDRRPTLRKTKFVVLAVTALVSTTAELPPPMFEHLAIGSSQNVVILCIPAQSMENQAQSMENHRHPAKQHSPAFAGKECNRLLSSHFMNQPAVERSTLSEITSASASERAFSIHGPDRLGRKRFTFLNLSNDRRSE